MHLLGLFRTNRQLRRDLKMQHAAIVAKAIHWRQTRDALEAEIARLQDDKPTTNSAA